MEEEQRFEEGQMRRWGFFVKEAVLRWFEDG
jgi:hypothetical protein